MAFKIGSGAVFTARERAEPVGAEASGEQASCKAKAQHAADRSHCLALVAALAANARERRLPQSSDNPRIFIKFRSPMFSDQAAFRGTLEILRRVAAKNCCKN